MATRSIVSKSIGESASTYTGVDGELIVDTTNNTLKISDGSSAGGVALITSAPRRISYTTDTGSGEGSAGSGPSCGITDDTIIETVLVTNHQGSTGSRFTLKASGGELSTTSAGKIATVHCVSGSNVVCDFFTAGGYSGQTLGSNSMETFFWTGTLWKRLTG